MPTVAHAASEAPSQLYLEAVKAYQTWIDFPIPNDREMSDAEWELIDTESFRLSDVCKAAIRACCDYNVAHPSLKAAGEVNALWRMTCWFTPEGPEMMTDNFEARALADILEAVSGIRAPERLLFLGLQNTKPVTV
jgi:hypothetical protein